MPDSIKSRISRKPNTHTKPSNGGVYGMLCKKDDCGDIYIGQSHDVPTHLKQHTDVKTQASKRYYASAKHNTGGHNLDTVNGFEVYKSDSLPHRLTVETCLLSICHKVKGNKASTSTRDMDTLAPMILEEAPIKWQKLAEVRPPCLRIDKVPMKYRKFFTDSIASNSAELSPENTMLPQVTPHYNLRPRRRRLNSSIP